MSDNMETTGLSGPVQNKGKPVSARRVLTILVFIAPTLLFYGFYNIINVYFIISGAMYLCTVGVWEN